MVNEKWKVRVIIGNEHFNNMKIVWLNKKESALDKKGFFSKGFFFKSSRLGKNMYLEQLFEQNIQRVFFISFIYSESIRIVMQQQVWVSLLLLKIGFKYYLHEKYPSTGILFLLGNGTVTTLLNDINIDELKSFTRIGTDTLHFITTLL